MLGILRTGNLSSPCDLDHDLHTNMFYDFITINILQKLKFLWVHIQFEKIGVRFSAICLFRAPIHFLYIYNASPKDPF